MNGVIEQRIARVARARGVSFYEAARICARSGARRRAAKRKQAEELTRLRSTWAWKESFE